MRQRKVKDLDAKMEAVSSWLVADPAPDVWKQVFAGGMQERPLYLEIGCGKGDFLLQHALAHPESDFIGIEGQPSVVLRAMEKAAAIRAGQTAEEDPEGPAPRILSNIRFACVFVNNMEELFAPGSLAGIFLNFSDPWPKARHAKRRLTWRGRLRDYAKALRPGGFIAVKTDNDPLFAFTLEEIAACGWIPNEMSRDLHGSTGRCDAGAPERVPTPEADSSVGAPERVPTSGLCESMKTPGLALTSGADSSVGAPERASTSGPCESAGEDPLTEARRIMTEYERKFRAAGKNINYVRVVP